jgi:hypothetical protein
MNKRELLVAAVSLLLLATALVRIAAPDRARLRPLSVASFEVQPTPVPAGETATVETQWSPPSDVYVMGWNPWIGLPPGVTFDAELMIYERHEKAALFVMGQRGTTASVTDAWREVNLPAGTGYRVRKGRPLTLRYRVTNGGGSPFTTRGATALVYYVGAEGN